MELKAIIFDLDGVITDTAHFHYLAWGAIAEKFGYQLTEEDNESIKGLSRRHSLEKVLEFAGVEVSEEEMTALSEEKNAQYQELLNNLTKEDTLVGVDEFLADCRKNNLKIAVGSASRNTKRILTQLGLIDFFDAIVDGTMVTHSKPDPEVFLQGADAIGVSPENVVVFEDAIAGVTAANAGGFFSVGVGDIETLGHAKKVIPNMDSFLIADLIALVSE